MRLNKIFKIASILSRSIDKSNTEKKHIAAIIKSGKILKSRTNTAGFHAETQVLKNIKSKDILIVIRYENGMFKNSKPCKECIDHFKKVKVKRVIYSTGDRTNPFVIEKVYNLCNNWISSLSKNKKKFNLHTCKR